MLSALTPSLHVSQGLQLLPTVARVRVLLRLVCPWLGMLCRSSGASARLRSSALTWGCRALVAVEPCQHHYQDRWDPSGVSHVGLEAWQQTRSKLECDGLVRTGVGLELALLLCLPRRFMQLGWALRLYRAL